MKRKQSHALGACLGWCVLGGVAQAQTELWSVGGIAANEQFGSSVALCGDLDGDGRSEVAAGAPQGAGGLGVVRVLSGATGALVWQATGPAAGSRFGAAVASVSDWNGDGRRELVVGAWGASTTGRSGAGSVRVYSGANGALLFEAFGDAANDHLGWTVAAVSDLDGDGREEFAVTAVDDDDGGSSAGSVRLYASVSGVTLRTLHGNAGLQLYGSSIASLRDLDGDGVGEIAVGGPFAASVTTQAGLVRVHSGATGAVLRSWTGVAVRDGFGGALCALGDLDGDGVDELAIGAKQIAPTGMGYVQIRSCSAAAVGVFATLTAPTNWRAFGARLASAGDVDYDGRVDLLIGAPDSIVSGPGSGAVRLWSSGTATALLDLVGTLTSERLGSALDAGRDVDGNGSPDYSVGASGAASAGTNSGRVHARSGNDVPPPPPPPAHDPLEADVTELVFRSNGTQVLSLRAGAEYAGLRYRLLSSLHGDDPGFTVHGVHVPLNRDRLFHITLRHPRLAPFDQARGVLDDAGEASAEFRLGRPWYMRWLIGQTFHHAYVVFDDDGQVVFASNAVACTIVR